MVLLMVVESEMVAVVAGRTAKRFLVCDRVCHYLARASFATGGLGGVVGVEGDIWFVVASCCWLWLEKAERERDRTRAGERREG